MAKIITEVTITVIDYKGEEFTVKRKAIANGTDNSRFWASIANTELAAISGAVIDQVGHQYGYESRTDG